MFAPTGDFGFVEGDGERCRPLSPAVAGALPVGEPFSPAQIYDIIM